MPQTLALADRIAGGAEALPPAFRCWWTIAGRDAAYVDIDRVEPWVEALTPLVDAGAAS
jgi:hypothetical protein